MKVYEMPMSKMDRSFGFLVNRAFQHQPATRYFKGSMDMGSPEVKNCKTMISAALDSAHILRRSVDILRSDAGNDAKRKMLLGLTQEAGVEVTEQMQYLLGLSETAASKQDESPVTFPDVFLNQLLRDRLSVIEGFPFLGEEDAKRDPSVHKNGNYMAVDPIDGTGNFTKMLEGKKVEAQDYVTLISQVVNGKPVSGVCFNHNTGELDAALDTGLGQWIMHMMPWGPAEFDFAGKTVADRIGEAVEKTGPNLLIRGLVKSKASASDVVNPHYTQNYPYAMIGGAGCRVIALCDPRIENGLFYHKGQTPGLWDMAAANVFARLCGVDLRVNDGTALDYTADSKFPAAGVHAVKGDGLGFVWSNWHQPE